MKLDDQEWQQGERDREARWRRIYHIMGDAIEGWRTCSVLTCRRNKRCSDDSFACIEKKRRENTRVFTPEESSQSIHELRLMIDARLAEFRGQAVEDEKAEEAMPWRKRVLGK